MAEDRTPKLGTINDPALEVEEQRAGRKHDRPAEKDRGSPRTSPVGETEPDGIRRKFQELHFT